MSTRYRTRQDGDLRRGIFWLCNFVKRHRHKGTIEERFVLQRTLCQMPHYPAWVHAVDSLFGRHGNQAVLERWRESMYQSGFGGHVIIVPQPRRTCLLCCQENDARSILDALRSVVNSMYEGSWTWK
jgi:hypothetical protein